MGDDSVTEAYAMEEFFFDGIANLFVTGSMFHVTFWSWQKTETGILKFGIRRGVCPVENVPHCAEQALAAVARSTLRKITGPISRSLS